MRRLVLIRHGTTDDSTAAERFVSRTDVPLNKLGKEDAELLAKKLKTMLSHPFAFYASPLQRSRLTAEALTAIWPEVGPPALIDDLMEVASGEWEGLPFTEIKRRYPREWAMFQQDATQHAPPGGESHAACQVRVYHEIQKLVQQTDGDVVIVAHAIVNLVFLAKVLNWSLSGLRAQPQPPGCYNVLSIESDGSYTPIVLAAMPTAAPSTLRTASIQEKYKMHPQVIAHTTLVRSIAMRFGEGLNRKRLQTGEVLVDLDVLGAAADLHDICRGERKHAKAGAALLQRLGYPKVAEVIGNHQDLPDEKQVQIDESSLLYLADKCVIEDEFLGVEGRFANSYWYDDGEKARAKHARRKAAALQVQRSLEKELGYSI